MRIDKWLGFVVVACVALTGCGSNEAQSGLNLLSGSEPETVLSKYRTFNGEPLYRASQGNCSTNELTLPGQGLHFSGGGLHFSGGVGGLVRTAPKEPVSSGSVGQRLVHDFGGFNPQHDAALLVVDDFNGNSFQLGSSFFTLGALDLTQGDVDKLLHRGEFSHGALVFNHAVSVLAGTGAYEVSKLRFGNYTIPQVHPNSHVIFRHKVTGKRLVVMMADTVGYNTRLIASKTQAALEKLNNMGIDKIAVNMSFTVVPCSVLEDFIANKHRFPTFEVYAKALAGTGAKELMDAVFGVVGQTNDPLLELINAYREEHVFVASAGNFGLPYPTYPAAHRAAIAVSASEVQDPGNPAFFSNHGEVLEVGAWYHAVNLSEINGHSMSESVVAYAGTSFSAPNVAVFSTLDLSRRTPKCGLRGGTAKLAYGKLLNLTLNSATSLFCR